MTQMFEAMGIGLAVAVFVILILLTAYFQSPRLALISVGAVPGVLAGIVVSSTSPTPRSTSSRSWARSCASGVSVSNSVMMVTFMDEHWKAGKSSTDAAIQGASERLRPILMTACAMSIGMVPMALALERGSQMEAPLGPGRDRRAGDVDVRDLAGAPSIFALVIGEQEPRSPSLYPGNPESAHYDPELDAGSERPAKRATMAATTVRRRGGLVTMCDRRSSVTARRDGRPITSGSGSWPCSLAVAGCSKEREDGPERLGAAGPARGPSRAPENHPRRRTAELHPELRAHVDLSEADRVHREVERGYRRQGAEGRRARRALRARAARALRDEEGDRRSTTRSGSGWPRRTWRSTPPMSRPPGRAWTRPGRSWASTRPRSSAGTSRSSGSTREVDRTVVDPQILLESTNQWKSNIAARDAAKAAIVKAEAELLAAEATLARAEVNVAVARADLAVAESEAKRLEAWVGYLKLLAPYDGIIVARNANTWDFVLPSTGDPTAEMRAPDLSPGEKAAPIYVVDRTDIVRIYVDVPERDANYVHIGSEARVKLWAYRDEWLPASVTRLSWALNNKSRTMRAEIDLPNPGSQILPGMYAYGEVVVERPDVRRCPSRPSPMPAASRSSGGTRTATRCAPKSRRASGTASGSRSPIATSSRNRPAQGRLGADRTLGTGARGQQAVDPDRRGPVRLSDSPAQTREDSSQTQRLEQREATDGSGKTFEERKDSEEPCQARSDTATTASPVPRRIATTTDDDQGQTAASMAGSR